MKTQITELFAQALEACRDTLIPDSATVPTPVVERTRDPSHGDFACNIAMVLAKPARKSPRQIAETLCAAFPESALVAKLDIAGPGFINLHLTPAAYHRMVAEILDKAETFGTSASNAGARVLVEFVSANPTGPLHVGHGRHAAYGATVANLLEAVGFTVHREYYVNDAGRQMDILAVSTWLRYLEVCGERITFPSNGYRGDYIREIAKNLHAQHGADLSRKHSELFAAGLPPDAPEGDKEAHIDALIARGKKLLGNQFELVFDASLNAILDDIRDDLARFGVQVDRYYSERELFSSGLVDEAITRLEEQGLVFEKSGAKWFKATEFGDEKDRVVVRENGQKTYIASDIAYHLDKRKRGNDLLLDVLGSDHHGYVARVRAGLIAMGEPADSLEVRLVQFAVLFRGGEKVQMSTRSGEFVTLRQLCEEVGNDAARFFYVMRSNDQHLDFDLELAKSRSNDNPVYYIQYAHARVCSVFRQLSEKALKFDPENGVLSLGQLGETHETALMTMLSRYPEMLQLAAENRAPQHLVHYLRDLAHDFHTYYNAHQFLVDDAPLRNARLVLIAATRQVIGNGLALLGVSAPEAM
ncbi:MAG: arginine--tRNA ligase [Gammaproteobacteria bacterium]|nr:arginine--tRNA ligase [Gammaproteobacteria bacterium]